MTEQNAIEICLDLARQALDKASPKKAAKERVLFGEDYQTVEVCPVCGRAIERRFLFCPFCGQRINWED